MVLVLWGLWMARDHLKDVVRKAWNPAYPIDDRRELMSYRAAVLGFLLGTFYMLTWLHEAGMEWLGGHALFWLAYSSPIWVLRA